MERKGAVALRRGLGKDGSKEARLVQAGGTAE